ncbi:MAG: hypothetical protein LBD31_00115 [Treponema sp.]|jgi:hypothetical protein|nr:hypothetical protein [Treponema sp.]
MNGTASRTETNDFLFRALFMAGIVSLAACASSGPRHSFQTDNFSPPGHRNEDINGNFPEAVYIKTRTQTFNTYHYYILNGGLIWYKSVNPGQEPKHWTLFAKTGLPHNNRRSPANKTRAVVEIAADADELVALSAEGAFYRYCFDPTIAHRSGVWLDKQGWPAEEQLYLDKRTADNRAWAIGKRNMQVLYYEDTFGNQHHNGVQEIVTTYVLLEDGQEIAYTDPGLPSDFSRNYLGPERGTFKALSLSASASTMFVINEAGLLYTRMADFDITGGDPMFFKYTYIPYKSPLAGTAYLSNLTEWALPPEDWRKQPSIPLEGNAAITRRITVLQNGQGNAARELRVAGRNENGEIGYWTKAIFDDVWSFISAPLSLDKEDFLPLRSGGDMREDRGASLDKSYRGFRWTGGEREEDLEYEIPNFNILEGDCDLRVTYRGETCVLRLHPVEMWTFLKRDYLPGRSGPPKLFLVTLEIPENALSGLSAEFARRITGQFAKDDRALFRYTLAASSRFLILRNSTGAAVEQHPSALFLTDGTLSSCYPEFRPTSYITGYDEFRRYASPELVFTAGSRDELNRKIALNKTFLAELKTRIAGLWQDKSAAIGLDMIYIPLHYTVRLSPLRFIDVPKIRTMTSYGERIVLANSFYTGTISDTRIWVDRKVTALLETRIRCYEETSASAAEGGTMLLPPWYSETITGYWDRAGLPRRVRGNFISPGGRIPAELSLHPGEENGDYAGWYLSLDGAGSFTFFLDPRKSAGTIYSRRGKTPGQKKLNIRCTLYVNPGRTGALERRVIENSVKPFYSARGEGIDVSITYDGTTFEIREYPPQHGSTLIFRGQGSGR